MLVLGRGRRRGDGLLCWGWVAPCIYCPHPFQEFAVPGCFSPRCGKTGLAPAVLLLPSSVEGAYWIGAAAFHLPEAWLVLFSLWLEAWPDSAQVDLLRLSPVLVGC